MMKLTRNLWIYEILNSVSTFIFITLLNQGVIITDDYDQTLAYAYTYMSWLPIIYAGVWFFSGLILGYLDKPRKTRHDIDFMYSLMTLIILTFGAVYYMLLFKELRSWWYILAFAWLVQLIYWYLVKNALKAYVKKTFLSNKYFC